MRAVKIVDMEPRFEFLLALERVQIRAGVSPFSEGGLDKAFGLALGAWGVGAGKAVFDVELVEGIAEAPVSVAGAVIGKDAADGDAEAGVKGAGHEEEEDGGAMTLIGEDGGEGDAGMVIDGDVQVLPAGAASFPAAVAVDAMAGVHDAGQTLDIQVQQVSRVVVFVANHRGRRVQGAQLAQAVFS